MILVAEDDKLNRMMLCKLLQKFGTECETAGDGKEAIDKCFSGKYDVVMLDFNMPKYSGSECAVMIKEKFKGSGDCPLIVGVSADEEHGENEAFDEFLAKPFNIEKIKQIIERVSKEV